eukprot:3035403-Amphidinium_carterae.2
MPIAWLTFRVVLDGSCQQNAYHKAMHQYDESALSRKCAIELPVSCIAFDAPQDRACRSQSRMNGFGQWSQIATQYLQAPAISLLPYHSAARKTRVFATHELRLGLSVKLL